MLLLFNVQSAGCNGPKMAVSVAPLVPDSDRFFAAGVGDPPLIATGIITAPIMRPSVISAVAVAVPTVLPAASVNETLGDIVKFALDAVIGAKRTASMEASAIVALSVWAPDGMPERVRGAVPLVGVLAGIVNVSGAPTPTDSMISTSAAPIGPSVTVAVTTKLSVSPEAVVVIVTNGRIVTGVGMIVRSIPLVVMLLSSLQTPGVRPVKVWLCGPLLLERAGNDLPCLAPPGPSMAAVIRTASLGAIVPSLIRAVAVAVAPPSLDASVSVTLGGMVIVARGLVIRRVLEGADALIVIAPDGTVVNVAVRDVLVPRVSISVVSFMRVDDESSSSIFSGTSSLPIGPSLTVAVTITLSISSGANAAVTVTTGRIVAVVADSIVRSIPRRSSSPDLATVKCPDARRQPCKDSCLHPAAAGR